VSGLSTLNSVLILSAQLTRAFATRRGFPRDRGAEQPHRAVFLRQLGFKLACLGQLCVDVGPPRRRGGRGVWPRSQARSSSQSRRNLSVAGTCRVSGVCWVIGDYDVALPRGVIAPGAGVVGVAEPVVRGVEESPEHHTGEVPLRVSMRSGRRQLVGGALG
jgi:hypothetical protein